MIEGVSAQIIKKYVGNVRKLLEAPAAQAAADAALAAEGTDTGTGTASAPPPRPSMPEKEDSINVLAVVFKVIADRIKAFFRRLVGRS